MIMMNRKKEEGGGEREEGRILTHFRRFLSTVIGKAQQSTWQREFVIEAVSILIIQGIERAKMKLEVGVTIKDLP